jgi:hypothetical protein
MKHLAFVLALLPVLVTGACASGGAAFDNFNAPAAYEGPGCYDHKNRIERTVKTRTECETLTWTWKP